MMMMMMMTKNGEHPAPYPKDNGGSIPVGKEVGTRSYN
jgi:hypothetical protein